MKANMNQYKNEKSHLENVVMNITDNRLLGIMFIISMIGFVFLRRNFGVRIIKLELVIMTFTAMVILEGITSWFSELPLIGRSVDFSSFLILGILYVGMSIYHLVRAYIDARTIPFRYTRSMGDGYVFDWISKLNVPFLGKNELRINAIAEPIVMIVIALIIGKWIPPLGNFLVIVAICMATVGVFTIKNHDRLKYDQNDALLLGEMTQDNMKEAKPGSRKTGVSHSKKATVSQPVKRPNAK